MLQIAISKGFFRGNSFKKGMKVANIKMQKTKKLCNQSNARAF